jgi:predicted nucleic acid-binding protein
VGQVSTQPDLLYLDANVLIGIVEASPQLSQGQLDLLAELDDGHLRAMTSELSLSEVLIGPLQKDDAATFDAFTALLSGQGTIAVAPISREVLFAAARLRATSRMKLPDAIHVATADVAGCAGFVSADRGVRLPPGMRAMVWDRLGPPAAETVG